MAKKFSIALDPKDKTIKQRFHDVDYTSQQLLLVTATVKDIFESFIESQYTADGEPPAALDFSKLHGFVHIEESDPFMVLLLTTELFRVLIDQHNVDFYDAAPMVSAMITYTPHDNQDEQSRKDFGIRAL